MPLVPVLSPSPALTPTEAALSAAMAEVERFAREHIQQPTHWRPFAAAAGNQRTTGLWQPLRQLGPQVLLLSVERPLGPIEPLWVARPTGILVLEGSFVATVKSPAGEEGRDIVVQQQVEKGQKELLDMPVMYGIDPIGERCLLLVTRLLPFRGTPPERMLTHTISGLSRTEAEALHAKMRQLFLG